MKRMSTLIAEVRRLDPNLSPDDDTFDTAVLLLASLVVGTGIRALTKYTKFPMSFVSERVHRLRESGVFCGKKIACEWFEENGAIAFWLDVCVAEGMIERK